MAHRVLVDEAGTKWEVWEVLPTRAERRVRQRRLAQEKVEGDRRKNPDRRARREQRISLGPELIHGWLAFHSAEEKRRYAPIPPGWTELSSKELAKLCREAHVVQPTGEDDLPRDVSPPKPGIASRPEQPEGNREGEDLDGTNGPQATPC